MPDESEDHVHIIVSGDTLGGVARRYHINLEDLLAANPEIKDPNRIFKGQRVKIPHAAAPAPVMTPPTIPTAAHNTPTPEADTPHLGGMPNTSGMDAAHRYDLYAQYFSRYGVNVAALAPGTRVLLGLRVTSNTHVRGGQGEFDDRIVVLWREPGGAKKAEEFTANTEPSSRYEDTPENRRLKPKKIFGEDANKDGRRDLGCLPDGLYQYKRDWSGTYKNILRPKHDQFVVRDVDHDGDFDEEDKVRSVKELLNSHDSILFHPGDTSFTGSAGCQTMKPNDFRAFWKTLGGTQGDFEYAVATVA
jgi:LysM repeat protein